MLQIDSEGTEREELSWLSVRGSAGQDCIGRQVVVLASAPSSIAMFSRLG